MVMVPPGLRGDNARYFRWSFGLEQWVDWFWIVDLSLLRGLNSLLLGEDSEFFLAESDVAGLGEAAVLEEPRVVVGGNR